MEIVLMKSNGKKDVIEDRFIGGFYEGDFLKTDEEGKLYVTYKGVRYNYRSGSTTELIFDEYTEKTDKEKVRDIIEELTGSGIVRVSPRRVTNSVRDESKETKGVEVSIRAVETIEAEVSIKKPSLSQLKNGWILTTTGSVKYAANADYTEKKLQKIFRNGRWFNNYTDAFKKQQEERVLGNIKVVREMLNDGWEEDYGTGYCISYDADDFYVGVQKAYSTDGFSKLGLYKDEVSAKVIVSLFEDEIKRFLV